MEAFRFRVVRKLISRMLEFRKIYYFAAVGDRDKLIRGQRVKGQGHSETTHAY